MIENEEEEIVIYAKKKIESVILFINSTFLDFFRLLATNNFKTKIY